MKKIKLEMPVTIYETMDELPTTHQDVFDAAYAALDDAYAPYSKFHVGVGMRLENGTIIKGANQENAAYPMCLCAERVALGTASMQHKGVAIQVMAIVVRNISKLIETPAAPCGSCRQAIYEMEQRQKEGITILLRGEVGPIWEIPSGNHLLPLSFNSDFL
jgi:cytidine deaminase